MTYITNYTYKGWNIESFDKPKHMKLKGWTAYPPDYDYEENNGYGVIYCLGLQEIKSEINEYITPCPQKQPHPAHDATR